MNGENKLIPKRIAIMRSSIRGKDHILAKKMKRTTVEDNEIYDTLKKELMKTGNILENISYLDFSNLRKTKLMSQIILKLPGFSEFTIIHKIVDKQSIIRACESFKYLNVDKNTTLISQGHFYTLFYGVISGSFGFYILRENYRRVIDSEELNQNKNDNEIIKKKDYLNLPESEQKKYVKVIFWELVAIKSRGEFFGAFEMFYHKLSKFKVVALEDSEVMYLNYTDFNNIFGRQFFKTHTEYKNLLVEKFPLFNKYIKKSNETFYSFINLKYIKYPDYLYKENQVGKTIYFILSGNLSLEKTINLNNFTLNKEKNTCSKYSDLVMYLISNECNNTSLEDKNGSINSKTVDKMSVVRKDSCENISSAYFNNSISTRTVLTKFSVITCDSQDLKESTIEEVKLTNLSKEKLHNKEISIHSKEILILDKGDLIGLECLFDEGKYNYSVKCKSSSALLMEINVEHLDQNIILKILEVLTNFQLKREEFIQQKIYKLKIAQNKYKANYSSFKKTINKSLALKQKCINNIISSSYNKMVEFKKIPKQSCIYNDFKGKINKNSTNGNMPINLDKNLDKISTIYNEENENEPIENKFMTIASTSTNFKNLKLLDNIKDKDNERDQELSLEERDFIKLEISNNDPQINTSKYRKNKNNFSGNFIDLENHRNFQRPLSTTTLFTTIRDRSQNFNKKLTENLFTESARSLHTVNLSSHKNKKNDIKENQLDSMSMNFSTNRFKNYIRPNSSLTNVVIHPCVSKTVFNKMNTYKETNKNIDLLISPLNEAKKKKVSIIGYPISNRSSNLDINISKDYQVPQFITKHNVNSTRLVLKSTIKQSIENWKKFVAKESDTTQVNSNTIKGYDSPKQERKFTEQSGYIKSQTNSSAKKSSKLNNMMIYNDSIQKFKEFRRGVTLSEKRYKNLNKMTPENKKINEEIKDKSNLFSPNHSDKKEKIDNKINESNNNRKKKVIIISPSKLITVNENKHDKKKSKSELSPHVDDISSYDKKNSQIINNNQITPKVKHMNYFSGKYNLPLYCCVSNNSKVTTNAKNLI